MIYLWTQRRELASRKSPKNEDFLVIWTIIGFIIIYLPVGVQRRFLLGTAIPLALISAIFLSRIAWPYLSKEWKMNKTIGNILVTLIIIFTVSTNIYTTFRQIEDLHTTEVGEFRNVKYLSSGEMNAIEWIDSDTKNDDVILAPQKISNYLPALTGNRIFSGHWAQTINFEEKFKLAEKFYSSGEIPANLPIIYIWWPTNSNALAPKNLAEAYRNPEVIIYKYG